MRHSESPDGDPWLVLSNEFTTVKVRKVRTRNGVRLEIFSPRLGYVIQLDPLELESLTWQEPETFSRLLETPYGPEEIPEGRSLTELIFFHQLLSDTQPGE